MNVALYRAGRDRWTMTERGRSSVTRDESGISIGASAMCWDGAALRVEIDEWTAPFPSRVRGTVTLRPEFIAEDIHALDSAERHLWRPIAPRARVDVHFDKGGVSWSGDAYFDCNWGAEPLEQAFRAWTWSRAHMSDGAIIHYDVTPREGLERSMAFYFDRYGVASSIEPPARASLPETFWRMSRSARGSTRVLRTLEDAPFYARTALAGQVNGAPADIVHESLSLDRLRLPIVRAMLPFRMPRLVGRR